MNVIPLFYVFIDGWWGPVFTLLLEMAVFGE